MIVIIDNYDSFTYNLYQYVGEIHPDVRVFRNDKVTTAELLQMDISHLIISPGPGFPKDAGISMEAVKGLGKKIPTLGVCLGHQAIGEAFGGYIVHAQKAVHGKTSKILHNGEHLFQGLENPLDVTRYHSLVVDRKKLPKELEITAESSEGEIMGVKHKAYPIYGLQFHPESISTQRGKEMLRKFLVL
ncbi:anthranilate synthase component 2 [Geosporobacter subterraneus DSM 17957]|uniref:Anthranilate synthase component 2 n=1 Tax=Geosporobacter subterraneus DSM 17957 TaxID=1121919 RepID=A0A1M6L4M3_9FIRM|nr:aminodeoxychorismate/anthranilate synthase component II [Geosporobacter subterraneus]SHJ66175.1 anthranilate synthase component 2 [Geosporobacter subterraneus DSM 17957]